MMSEHKKTAWDKNADSNINLPSLANFPVEVPMLPPRRWGQKKVPKGSSRYVSASESRVPEAEAKIGR